MAIEGRYEFAINTNPFGAKDDKKKSKKQLEDEQRKADLKARQEAQALKFDMLQMKIRKEMGTE